MAQIYYFFKKLNFSTLAATVMPHFTSSPPHRECPTSLLPPYLLAPYSPLPLDPTVSQNHGLAIGLKSSKPFKPSFSIDWIRTTTKNYTYVQQYMNEFFFI